MRKQLELGLEYSKHNISVKIINLVFSLNFYFLHFKLCYLV